jgi:hypothetical protein
MTVDEWCEEHDVPVERLRDALQEAAEDQAALAARMPRGPWRHEEQHDRRERREALGSLTSEVIEGEGYAIYNDDARARSICISERYTVDLEARR